MATQGSRRLLAAATSMVTVATLAACGASTTGAGSATFGSSSGPPDTSTAPAPPTLPTSTSTVPGPPSTSTVTVAPPHSSAAPGPGSVPVSVRGTTSGKLYRAQLYAVSRITDCAAHSYGAAIVDYFRAHPCSHATRRLFTLDDNGRTVVMSTVTVDTAIGPSDDLYKWTGEFEKLENGDNNSSVNDLLREGYRIPGAQSSIPSNEAFDVGGQDNVVAVSDAWYEHGATADQDPHLVAIEQDLLVTPLTSPD